MNALTIDIRPATPGDAPAVSVVHEAAWGQTYAGIIPHRSLRAMISRRDSGWWERAIRRGTSVLLVDFAGTVAGYVTFGLNRARALPQDGEVYELYLLPEYQGIGLGSRLFDAARRELSAHGCRGLVVWALEENTPAVDFYIAKGGRDVAEGSETFDGKPLAKVAFVWN